MKPAEIPTHPIAKIFTSILIILLLGGLAAIFFSVKICEEQVTSRGAVVNVCRHVSSTDPPVMGIVLAAVALLAGVFFSEVSVFGITFKKQIERIQEETREAKEQAEESGRSTEEIREALHVTESDLYESVQRLRSGNAETEPAASDVLDLMAQEYNEIRLAMPSGDERTKAMTDIVRRMKAETRERADFDPVPFLESTDRGLRLVGFAAMCVHSHTDLIPRLVEIAILEDKPFGQLWALNALEKQLTYSPFALDTTSAERLQNFLTTLPYRSDRAIRIRHILQLFAKHLDIRPAE
ncbi:hypothetical protein [Streptomyces sp. NPDC087300]|uniref:hypothetical protein n=1 Tax=Streptomyces sp. NPDC087300 TaxID=3365780 RepID=UPI003825F77A